MDDYLPPKAQPHHKWVNQLLLNALVYRDIGATLEVVDPNGTRHTVTESFLRRATSILGRYIEYDESWGRVVYLTARSLKQEIEAYTGTKDGQEKIWYVLSPIEQSSFPVRFREVEAGTTPGYHRLVTEWKRQFACFLLTDKDMGQDSRMVVVRAATDLVQVLGKPPLDEIYENDSGESALFA